MSFADSAVEISLCDCAHKAIGWSDIRACHEFWLCNAATRELPTSRNACPTLAESFGFGATGRSRLGVRYARSVLLCLLHLYFPAQRIDLGVCSSQGCFQTRATGLQYFDLRQNPRAFALQLPATRVTCFLGMYCAIPGGSFDVLRSHLVLDLFKLADLQSKLEQIEYQMRPENIERAAGYGTVHPEEARDARRRQLESERSRV